MRILIVDDQEDNRYLLEALLKGNGHVVCQAANGAEALEMLANGGIDLIVSDILMPVMDGFELCRRVKADATHGRIAFIFYTATYTGPEDEAFAKKIGADRFLLKPCEPEALMAAIEEVMDAAGARQGQPPPVPAPAEEVLKLYSERLIRKLEQKMAQAEAEIAARRQAEKALRESEERYRTILDNIEAGYYEVDLAGNFTFFNDCMCRILGYCAAEMQGMNNREFMDPDNARKVFQTFHRVFASGEPAKAFDWELIRKDGSRCWLDTSVFLIRDENGDAAGFRGVARDITERKQAEAALRESEQKYRRMAENISDVVWTADLDLNVTYVSPSVERLVGEPAAVHLKRPLEERFSPDSLQRVLPIFLEELERERDPQADPKRARMIEVEHYRADGSSIWVSINLSFIRDPNGTAVGIQGVTRDITERKRAEEALRQSESRFRLFAQLAPVGIVILDSGQKTLYVSPAFTDLFGYTIEDIPCADAWWPLAFPDAALRRRVRQKWRTALAEAQRSSSAINPLEYPVACKDGQIRQIEFRMKFTEAMHVVVFSDVTARKQAEAERERLQAQLLQAHKMESVGRLAGGVAHDFNNMLSVILGHADFALERLDCEQPLFANLQQIRQAAARSADLTRQLLAFARKQTVAPRVLDLNEKLEGMLQMLRRLIGEDVELRWIPGAGLWPVRIDPSQVDQILANLCVNARDATGGAGRVTIETGTRVFEPSACLENPECLCGEYVFLAVSDNGCGMDRQTLANLFEPFFTTKPVGQGTGLGLATVYGIVRQNGGFIQVYSEPGQGTTFRIYLPRQGGQPPQEAPAAPEEPIAPGHGTVLLVEDEPSILEIGQVMLERLGYTVLTAATPKEALTTAGDHGGPIDLLITDVVMPGMNGRELARRIQGLYPGIKRLFMSGYTADAIAHHGVLEKGVHFIQKPFSLKDLAESARKALEEG